MLCGLVPVCCARLGACLPDGAPAGVPSCNHSPLHKLGVVTTWGCHRAQIGYYFAAFTIDRMWMCAARPQLNTLACLPARRQAVEN